MRKPARQRWTAAYDLDGSGAEVAGEGLSPAAGLGKLRAHWLLSAVIAWGALSFGAVYPWAFSTLAVACLVAAGLGLLVAHRESAPFSRTLLIALIALAGAILCQVVPLPVRTLQGISPATLAALERLDPLMAHGLTAFHPISLFPAATWTALLLYASLALLFVGSSRWLSVDGPASTIEAIGLIGVLLALIGIVQKPLFTGRIYGFWTPELPGSVFGPFVNKNHFAGWMLLAFPLTLGFVCCGIDLGMRRAFRTWRDRILWFSSPEANRLILAASAAVLMALSLVLTMSRSGITALAASIVLTSLFAVHRRSKRSIRAAVVGYLGVLVIVVVGWVGADAVIERFSATDWSEFNNRGGAWADAISVFRSFPLGGTGLNTYGYASLFYQQHYLNEHFAEAHNDYLQLAAEGGALLLIPIAACVFLFAREVRRGFAEDASSSRWWIRVGAVTSLTGIAIQETVDFSLQMPGNAALFAIVCAIAVHRAPSNVLLRWRSKNGGVRDVGRS